MGLIATTAASVAIMTLIFSAVAFPLVVSDFPGDLWLLLSVSGIWAGGILVAYVLFGLPLHALLARWDRQRLSHYAMAGASAGLVLSALSQILTWNIPRASLGRTTESVAYGLFQSAAIGLVCAVVFRLLAIKHRDQVARRLTRQ